ncbi:hypothetical protein AWC38_SpisGene15574 [Stylophora pistillata]|uniref:TNFR-Cys domain-containing protein n=1 Tax=Stylophora pistillata TaxID=50429 RepID=A0A2B4RT73_STYPI|nr:hypothetical protein AWC38_SpisGene15574 [Stylophora pistillata]
MAQQNVLTVKLPLLVKLPHQNVGIPNHYHLIHWGTVFHANWESRFPMNIVLLSALRVHIVRLRSGGDNCSRQADIECGKRCYSNDRYYDASKGDCLKCSKCCNDDQDVEEDEFTAVVLVLVLLFVVGMCLLWFCKLRPPKHSSVNPDGGTYKKRRTEVHYNSGSVPVELSKPHLESDGKACTSSCQNADKLVITSDSKPLRDLLNSSEQEEICELLDAPVCGKLPYEAIARWYGATHSTIKARIQEGKSEAVIEWLVAEMPELTVGEFTTVVKEKARRTDAADKLKAFDAKATKESIDAA